MIVVKAGGETIDLGAVEASPTIGITDYSRRETDDFGVTTVVKRGYARHMSVRLAVAYDEVDDLQRRLADLRATPAQWIADDRFSWLSVEGFYKDFQLDLAVPPLSYCTLTIEGLAELEPVADPGGDPAPAGDSSTLLLLNPVDVTDAMIVATNVPEADYPAWAAGTTYGLGARVIKTATHRIYESAAIGNIGNDPAGASGLWIDVGPTNRWAMFDQALGTATTRADGISITLAPGAIDAVALLDVVGTSVRVQAPGGYDRTIAVEARSITFLDLPGVAGNVIVTVAGAGTVSVGTLLVGHIAELGITEESPTAGITDFSRKEVDDFGAVTVVQRAWAKRMSTRALIRTDAIDLVADRIAAVRARPVLWIGDADKDSLTIYGFFKDFSIEVSETVSKVSLSIEGLSKAAAIVTPQPRGNYAAGATYVVGDTVVWAVADGGDGHGYVRTGIGNTTGISPADATKWLVYVERGADGSDGMDGTDGINGAPGANGQASYVHFAYADSADGTTNFTTGAGGSRTYIGVYSDFTAADSANPALYTWSLIKGADGANGTPGAPGANGAPSYVHIAYAGNANGTSNFHLSDPTGRTYVGIYTDSTLADSTNPALYTWSLIKGADGAQGATGATGTNSAQVRLYKRSVAAPTLPTAASTYTFATGAITDIDNGWTVTVPAVDGNQLWTTVATAAANTPTASIAAASWAPTTTVVGKIGSIDSLDIGGPLVVGAISLTDARITDKSLANVDAGANTKLASVAAYATAGDNFIVNPNLATDAASWVLTSGATREVVGGVPCIRMGYGTFAYPNGKSLIEMGQGKVYLTAYARQYGDRNTAYAQLEIIARDASNVVTLSANVRATIEPVVTLGPDYVRLVWVIDLPAGTVGAQLGFNAIVSGGGTFGYIEMRGFHGARSQQGADRTNENAKVISIDYGATTGINLIRNANYANGSAGISSMPATIQIVPLAGNEPAHILSSGTDAALEQVFYDPDIRLREGEILKGSFRLKTDGPRQFRVYARAYTEDLSTASASVAVFSQTVDTGGAWQTFSFADYAVPTGYSRVQFYLYFYRAAGTYTKFTGHFASTAERTATKGAVWGGDLIGTPVELTDGRVPAALNTDGTVKLPVPIAKIPAEAVNANNYVDGNGYYRINGVSTGIRIGNANITVDDALSSNLLRRVGSGTFIGELDAEKTAGKDLSVLVGRTADKLTYTGGATVDSLKPAQAGADATAGKSLSLLVDRNLDNIADSASYARVLSGEVSGGVPKLQIAGSGKRLADQRNLPPITALNLGYKFTGALSYTSTTTSATISVTAGSALIGSNPISYNAMSTTVSGTAGTIVTYFLYVNETANSSTWGGSKTLFAPTNGQAIYSDDNRVYIGAISVTFPSSGTGGGEGDPGGGLCVDEMSFLDPVTIARDVMPGDLIECTTREMSALRTINEPVEANRPGYEPSVRLITASGARVVVSCCTPMTLRDLTDAPASDMLGREVLVRRDRSLGWEPVVAVVTAGVRRVAKITVGNRMFFAGETRDARIATHNVISKP